MNIQIDVRVTAPDLSAAITHLADALQGGPTPAKAVQIDGFKSQELEVKSGPALVEMPAVAPDRAVRATPEPVITSTPEPKAAEPAPASTPDPVPGPAPTPAPVSAAPAVEAPAEKKRIDLDAICRAGAALIDQGKMAEVSEILKNKYGVMTVTQLKPDQYEGFAADLTGLGALL